jgi:hypothetical protein
LPQQREFDVIGYDKRGQVLLLGEVKSSRGTTEGWAAQFRKNILAHDTTPWARFFLIATPEKLYFWRQDTPNGGGEAPEFTIDASKELGPYFEKASLSPATIDDQGLEFLVSAWLFDMARSRPLSADQDASIRWLYDSGLLGALEQGRLAINAVP